MDEQEKLKLDALILQEKKRLDVIERAISALVASNVASRFDDAAEWQREIRKDRPLPGRD